MIHILNFNEEIIDFISRDDNVILSATQERNLNDNSETLEFSILSERAENLQKRNRVIIQDSNKKYREFIVERIEQDRTYTTVECVASYLEDIVKAKPVAPGKIEKKKPIEALEYVLESTGWTPSEFTDFSADRTTSWTGYHNRYELLLQLRTTYSMKLDFYIEITGNQVEGRYVVLKVPEPLFKGKEIAYGKDLLAMKRTVDTSEVKTALIALGPEQENGNRIQLEVKDDDAQDQFGLPEHYIWGIYEPETEDENMTERRLRTLATTELNKRKKQAISYEVSSCDVREIHPQDEIAIGDLVRIKDAGFTPPLYIEAEIIGEKYNLISGESDWTFGQYVEYKENDVKAFFHSKLSDIQQKLNDKFTNVNTIVADVVEGKLEYFERKIFKGSEPPENPVNDMLWLDTRNPDVAVLRRYWEGQWINATAEKAEDIGAITREKALYSELSNTFVNLSIQHSKLLNEMHDVINSEYLVDFDLKDELNTKLDATVSIYNNIKSNLESMTDETAAIGKLIDTQTLFLNYRMAMQNLYNVVERAKVAIDERFKLLQSQYTDEKFKEALNNVADKLGLTVNEDNQLVGEIDVSKQIDESVREMTNQMLRDYVTSSQYQSDQQGIIERLESSDSERRQLADRISDTVTKSEYENDVAQKLSTTKAEVLIEAEQSSNRVSKEVFNAKSKTLERYTSEFINNVSEGMSFRYDENGNIQSHSIGPQGIKFDATKFEINDGDVIVQNGITTIKEAYIDKLFSNQATVEYLKARDVDLNKATVSGSRDGESTVLSGGKIRSTGSFTRSFPQGNVTYEAYTESWNGVYRSGLISKNYGKKKLTDISRWLALTDKGVTTQREIHSKSPDKRGARFIDFFAEETYDSNVFGQGMHIYSGQDLKIESGYRLTFESSNEWYTQFLSSGVEIINNGASLVLKRQGAFTSEAGSGGQYISLQASDGSEHGHIGVLSNNRHLSLKSSFGEVHLRGAMTKVLNSKGENLTDIRARSFDLSGVGRIAFDKGDAYLQGQTGVRFTKYKSNTFVTAQAKDFVKASSRTLKTNIKDLKNGLSTIKELKPVSYDYISDLQEGNTSGDIGFISEDSPSISVENGKAISVQKVATWAILGIQELIKENEMLNNRIKDLQDKFDVMSNNWKELNNEPTS
ncbi:phage tail spike protein [Staphylococcus simulans]|uniref:phage tail spike protein n=1 Tax=Staphylococcus simulans TaxID=1286 RepID=UPI0021D2E54B|nr:phage tail spike protein [Staphylococcus simulans]UXV42987.1 tail fiber domain-containing protein [Staphylococcus simulans]